MGALCLTCKLCCTHGLFASAPVKDEEVDRLRGHRLPLIKHEDGWVIPFPCPAHNGRCSIYVDRPSVCRDYECRVLSAVNQGEMDEADGRRRLARANALVDSVRARVPGGRDLWGDVTRFCQDSPQWRVAHADLLFDLYELRALLRDIDPKTS